MVAGAVERLNLQLFGHKVKLVDMAYPPRHPSNGAAQFYSAVLAESHAICRVLCSCSGWRTYQQLLRYDEESAALVRSSFACAAVWLYVRQYQRFNQYPWKLGVIGHADVPEAAQYEAARAFTTSCPLALDAGFSRKLQGWTTKDEKMIHIAGILNPHWRRVLAIWSDQVELHTFDLECAHGANHLRTHRLNRWGLIAARSVNEFAASSARNAAAAIAAAAPPTHAAPQPVGDSTQRVKRNPSRLTKQKSALQLFHRRCSSRDAALGVLRGSAVSKQYWAKVKREWSELPDEDKRALQERDGGSGRVGCGRVPGPTHPENKWSPVLGAGAMCMWLRHGH